MRVMIRMLDGDVGGVGELHADLRDGRADRAHRERHDVHRAAAHGPGRARQLSPASRPGRASCWSGRRRLVLAADERPVLDAGDVAGVASGRDSCSAASSSSSCANVPDSTRLAQRSYSAAEPSHQSTGSARGSRAECSTHSMSLRLAVGGAVSCGMVVVTEIESFESRSAGRGRHRDETFRVADGRRIPPNVPKAAGSISPGLATMRPFPGPQPVR